jgi:hypothetical protein
VPTAVSSTEPQAPARRRGDQQPVRDAVRAVADVGHLLRFRMGALRHAWLAVVGLLLLLAVTAAVAVLPAYVDGAGGAGRAFEVQLVLPTALVAFVVLTIVSSAASGGGRELIPRDPSAIHPISPTTDHLGALLLAPLNIAWLLQAWALMGTVAFAVGPDSLLRAQVVLVLWLAVGTALAQVLAWILEGVRRVPHGIVGIRLLNVVVLGTALGLQLTDQILQVFDSVPTVRLVFAMVDPSPRLWWTTVAVLAVALVLLVALGAVPAHIAAHRTPRDEVRAESGRYAARPLPGSDLAALIRTDRGSVWRAVPMRRGVVVLALGPGIVAVLGDLQWGSMTVLPGLVTSGGALLYGVNVWCLDGRGALWRESLPIDPRTVFDARAVVLAEFLLVASLLTVAVAAVRAGVPSLPEVSALVSTLVVVTVQVVGASMRWSAKRPYAVDLRSARATPAPPSMMVAYSARLALSTTVTGLFFAALSQSDDWRLAVLFAVACVAWSGLRLLRARRQWCDPQERARIVTTVALA